MLHVPGLTSYHFQYDNWGTNPSLTPGASIIPGASNVEGSWSQIASSANIAQDCYWMHIFASGGATSTSAKNQLLDIGVDPAGGTAYSAIISDIVCGSSSALTVAATQQFVFPFFIKAGSSVAVRIQGSAATAGTVRIAVQFYGQPERPEVVPVGMYSDTLGTITNSSGPTFTPGNAADGTWVDLGATTRPLWWWQLGYQIDNGTITAERTFIDLAYGDATNKHILFRVMHSGSTGETVGRAANPDLTAFACYRPVAAGANIYIRGRCENAPDSGYNGVAIGVGG